MTLNVFNWELLNEDTQVSFSSEQLIKRYSKYFNENKLEVNLIFTSKEEMKRLNSEYRNKNSVTDVLSFNLDTETVLGEIYICPEYMKNTYSGDEYSEEILRLVVHGTLHLLGEDHEGEFEEADSNPEPMFVKQEEILENILNEII